MLEVEKHTGQRHNSAKLGEEAAVLIMQLKFAAVSLDWFAEVPARIVEKETF